jgi:trehalose/maltose hydrolase-like predicted phosphorylase
MAVWVLRRTVEALDSLAPAVRTELLGRLRLRNEELRRWAHISQTMFVPFHDGIISQFENYAELEELDWEKYRARYGDISRLDRILEAEDDDVARYKASKQADALMLFYLLPADELGDLLTGLGYAPEPELIPRTIDYYLARTSHGSTLSAVVHAWVLARAHRDQAAQFFRTALLSDISDVQGGTTAEGIHLAAMAGSVDLMQRCFAGLELRGDRLVINPCWPEPLGPLEFDVWYRNQPLRLAIRGTSVKVIAQPGPHPPIEVECRGQTATLSAGTTVRFRPVPARDKS